MTAVNVFQIHQRRYPLHYAFEVTMLCNCHLFTPAGKETHRRGASPHRRPIIPTFLSFLRLRKVLWLV